MSLRQLIVEVASALGISTLKSQQSEAIFQFLHGRDVFVALPTGYGKSLCYMALPWIFDRLRGVTNQSVVLVVSPLVALMADQVCSCAVARYVMRLAINLWRGNATLWIRRLPTRSPEVDGLI